jgi:hypothetical protein
MDSCDSMAADLAVTTRAIDDADVDLETELGAVVAAARSAINSYLGLTLIPTSTATATG